MIVYGPYKRRDNRAIVILYDEVTHKKITTKTYARYLMEQHLGRELEEWEHVDHVDEDKTNDVIENLQILTLVENVRKHVSHREYPPPVVLTCFCGTEFERPRWKVVQAASRGKTLCCSRTCSGRLAGKASGISRRNSSA